MTVLHFITGNKGKFEEVVAILRDIVQLDIDLPEIQAIDPLIKWFLKTIGNQGLFEIARRFETFGAEAKVMIGYARNHEEIYFFEGLLRGTIVSPRGEHGFGWDPIFQP